MLLCMRTTIDIPDPLFRMAKERAAETGVSLREVVLLALRAHLGAARPPRYVFRWRAEKGRLLPGVDVNDRHSLYDLLEGLE
jgi:hypothetical protein